MVFNTAVLSFLGYSEDENFSAGPRGRYFFVSLLALRPLRFVPELFLEVKAFFLHPSPGPHLSASQSGILSLLPTQPEKWWLRQGRVKPFHPGGLLNSLTLCQVSRPKKGSQKSLWEVPAPYMGPWGERRATTPKIGAHPMSPSPQHYKVCLINDSIVAPTARPPPLPPQHLQNPSCTSSLACTQLYKPRRSYPKKL